MTASAQMSAMATARSQLGATSNRPDQEPRKDRGGERPTYRPGADEHISGEMFRAVFRQHAAGVCIITAQGARPVGFTATSLASVAMDPPLLSFGVDTASSSWPTLAEVDHVGVNILKEDQVELARTFARSGVDRFAGTRWRAGAHGVPVLDGVLAWLVCRVVAQIPAGDHRIVVAEAISADPTSPGNPLLYQQGRFTALSD